MITQLAGNGRILLTLNDEGGWEDLFYPYPGQFRNLREHRLGIFDEADGTFRWLRPGQGLSWEGPDPAEEGCPTTAWRSDDLVVRTEDLVHPNHDVLLRSVRIESGVERRLRLFSYQSFTIAESMFQETAYVDPASWSLVHYKRGYYFELFGDPPFDEAVCGEHTLKGLQGTYVDAEDGRLEGGQIAHGAADSVLQWNVHIHPGTPSTVRIVLVIARSPEGVHRVRDEVRSVGPARYESEAKAYTQAWIRRHQIGLDDDLDAEARRLVRSSLLVLQRSAASNGAIIASPDTRSLAVGGDSYNYCWWRDGAYIARAMDDSGLGAYTGRFLHFAQRCQRSDGSFLHRHFPDGEIGSTWHPPPFLQIDQTASVVAAVEHHLARGADPDVMLEVWPMVKAAADFLTGFRDEPGGLTAASFDLWEERFGVHAYSAAAVAHALEAADRIAAVLGKDHPSWRVAAQEIRSAAVDRMWDPALGRFVRSLQPRDERIDASLLLALDLDLVPPGDPRFRSTVETVRGRLWKPATGGIARYEDDTYYGPENPWVVCTAWLAFAELRLGDRAAAKAHLDWIVRCQTPTGLLPEQVAGPGPQPRGATPLAWSHAAFLELVARYRAASRSVAPTTAPQAIPPVRVARRAPVPSGGGGAHAVPR